MAKRKHNTPIPPFPPELDRQHFASWLSGFVDGEGCFSLGMHCRYRKHGGWYRACFQIALRHDDQPILEVIRSFLGCGGLSCVGHRQAVGSKRKPYSQLRVSQLSDLTGKVIPQFRSFPLLAKKRRDFEIWVQGVETLSRIKARKRRGANRPGSRREGTHPSWTTEERAEMAALCATLKAQREYGSSAVELPAPNPEPPTLFNWCP